MNDRIDYPTIDKACNGSFIQVDGKWHQMLELCGRCYNHGNDVKPGRGEIVLENSDFVYDQIVIEKRTRSIDWINWLPCPVYGATW